MVDHEFAPGPPPTDVKPCPCEEGVCTDQLAWCQVCHAGKDAYQHLNDTATETHLVVAGDLAIGIQTHGEE